MLPPRCTGAAPPPRSARVAASASRPAARVDVGVDLVGGEPQRGEARRSSRPGSPKECRPGRPAPRARASPSRRRGRRTPRPGSRRPSPCRTSPGRARQPSTAPSRPHWPERLTRKPVITSSLTNSAPWRAQVSARNRLKPGPGGTTPMLPGDASVITQAISSPCSAKACARRPRVVVGQHQRRGGRRRRDAGRAGHRQGGEAGAGLREQRVDVAVVAAGELHHEVAAGEAAGQPDADMVASVPEETKRTFSTGVRPTISSASSTSGAVGVPYDVPRATASARPPAPRGARGRGASGPS